MRRPAEYPRPKYTDPNDLRLVQIIKRSSSARPRALNIIGAPFDGAVLGRKGAAEGPAAIRKSMSSFSNYNAELGVDLGKARIFDLGDIEVDRSDVYAAHGQIKKEVLGNLRRDSLLVVLGGDNSISLPSLSACAESFGPLGLVVIDSHLDLRGKIGGKPTSGSSYGLAVATLDELDPRRVVEMGSHGFLNSQTYFAKAKKLGITIIGGATIVEKGPKQAASEAFRIASEGVDAVYLSIDLDVLDIAEVSGVSAPSAGGLDSRDVFEMVYRISSEGKVKCTDIVELAPSLDLTGRSSRVAGGVLSYLAAGFESRK